MCAASRVCCRWPRISVAVPWWTLILDEDVTPGVRSNFGPARSRWTCDGESTAHGEAFASRVVPGCSPGWFPSSPGGRSTTRGQGSSPVTESSRDTGRTYDPSAERPGDIARGGAHVLGGATVNAYVASYRGQARRASAPASSSPRVARTRPTRRPHPPRGPVPSVRISATTLPVPACAAPAHRASW